MRFLHIYVTCLCQVCTFMFIFHLSYISYFFQSCIFDKTYIFWNLFINTFKMNLNFHVISHSIQSIFGNIFIRYVVSLLQLHNIFLQLHLCFLLKQIGESGFASIFCFTLHHYVHSMVFLFFFFHEHIQQIIDLYIESIFL